MNAYRTNPNGYLISALLGAAAGGLAVVWVTNAIPKMMRRLMANMMDNMREQMSISGCKPEEV